MRPRLRTCQHGQLKLSHQQSTLLGHPDTLPQTVVASTQGRPTQGEFLEKASFSRLAVTEKAQQSCCYCPETYMLRRRTLVISTVNGMSSTSSPVRLPLLPIEKCPMPFAPQPP